MVYKIVVFLFCAGMWLEVPAQNFLQARIKAETEGVRARVGVAVLSPEGEAVTVNGDTAYAMLSTFKLPLAMAVLDRLDRWGTSLDSALFVSREELLPNTYSPLRDKHPEGNLAVSLRDLLVYSVAQSDNNACDILLRFLGGTERVQSYIEGLGIRGMEISVTEDEMHRDRMLQYRNRTFPMAAAELVDMVVRKELFSPAYRDFLRQTLIGTSTGGNKLKGLLPSSTVVGHKTGSSDRLEGVKVADNDMGFVLLPEGRHYSIAVFVADSRETDERNAEVIARISKIVYDYYR